MENNYKEEVGSQHQHTSKTLKNTLRAVPPGLFAEYGLQLYIEGKREEGLNNLYKEVELYPDSEKYVSEIINQLTNESDTHPL